MAKIKYLVGNVLKEFALNCLDIIEVQGLPANVIHIPVRTV
jgi:hypothetical protein